MRSVLKESSSGHWSLPICFPFLTSLPNCLNGSKPCCWIKPRFNCLRKGPVPASFNSEGRWTQLLRTSPLFCPHLSYPPISMTSFVCNPLRGMDSADPPGMSSKILSSGCFKIFIGKGNYRYHKLFLVLFRGFFGLRDKLRLPL